MIAAGTPVLVHNCLSNNREIGLQQIEMKTAKDRGITPVVLGPGAGVKGLKDVLKNAAPNTEHLFKWAITMDGDLKIMPAFAGGTSGGWPKAELAHTVFAGVGGTVRAAGTGKVDDVFGIVINDSSGHFRPTDGLLDLGKAKFEAAGIDVIAMSWTLTGDFLDGV